MGMIEEDNGPGSIAAVASNNSAQDNYTTAPQATTNTNPQQAPNDSEKPASSGQQTSSLAAQSMNSAFGEESRVVRVRRSTVGWNSKRLWNVYPEGENYCASNLISAPYFHHFHQRSVIPYRYVTPFNDDQKSRIRGAMAAIEQNSCIRFRLIESDAALVPYADSYVEIMDASGGGCHSVIGRKLTEKVSKVKLEATVAADKTCIEHHIVLHELLHLVGLYHEHQRPGRDQWLDIVWGNVQPGRESNFKIMHAKSYGLPFDPNSIMQYRANTFAINKSKPVLVPKWPYEQCKDVLGMAQDASEIDWLKVNLLYRCPFSRTMLQQFVEKRKYWQANPRPLQPLQPTSPEPEKAAHLDHSLSKARKKLRKKKRLEAAAAKRKRHGRKHSDADNHSEGKTAGAGGKKRKAYRQVKGKKSRRGGRNKKKKGAVGKKKGRRTRRTRKG